jgi:hypothetical protein
MRRIVHGRGGVLLVVAGVLLVAGLWVGWTLWSASRALGDAANHAQVMRAALIRGDADGARLAMREYQDSVDTAERRTGGLTWSALELVPGFGDDLRGIEVVSSVLGDIGRDGLPPLADAAEEVSGEAFRPKGHAFPIDEIAGLAGPAERSQGAFDRAEERLAKIDSSSFVGPVRAKFDELRDLVGTTRSTLGSTYRAARLLPALLGKDRPRNILLVLQNNAEARSSGGLPGALTLLHTDRGRVRVAEQSDAGDLHSTPEPILPLTADERRVFGPMLGRYAVDATLTPDFARAADLIRARWEMFRGSRIDAVVFVDPVAVSYLMSGTGGIAVPGYPGITASTVVAAVENQIYRATEDRRAQSAYQQAVAKAVFDALADGTGNSVATLTGLVRGVEEGRVRLHLFDGAEQQEIAGTKIAGEFPSGPTRVPRVGVYVNDAGPTKMQYYLKYTAHAVARDCAGGRQTIAGTVEFHSDTPADPRSLPPAITGAGYPNVRVTPGNQLLVLYITTPVGGEVGRFELDGQLMDGPDVLQFAGRGLARVAVSLEPQERHTLQFVVRSGKGQDGDARLEVSPGASIGSSNATIPSACAIR